MVESIVVAAGAVAVGLLLWRLFPNDRDAVSEKVDAVLSKAGLRALWFGTATLALAVLALALLL